MRDIPESRVEPYVVPPAQDEAAEFLTGGVAFRAWKPDGAPPPPLLLSESLLGLHAPQLPEFVR